VSGVFAAAVATLVGSALLLYGPLGWEAPEHLPHFFISQAALFLMSLAMALATWFRLFSPLEAARVGVVYQLVGAFVISSCVFQGDMLLQPVVVSLSWLAVWILLFPVFVPAPPLRSLVVSLLCATTAPLVFGTWSMVKAQPLPELPVLAQTFLPYYVCAALAVVPAWLVYDLGTSVSAAREEVRELGSYRLLELLGEGGMGQVWRGEHSLLARPAAIKLVREPRRGKTGTLGSQAQVEAYARFAREAQATAALTSPHTVSLYDYGVTEDGTLYYAMELLDGVDLDVLVEQFGPVSPARAVYLLRQACESLAEAHRAGLVHRDIKPANLMACHVGERVDFVKVLDFGLVRRIRRTEEELVASDPNYVLGTPAFMAPELASSPEDIDGRVDIYALGCVAYWLLTGRLVFEASTVAGVVADHVHQEPVPPSQRARQGIPASFEQLILECLAKDPQERPQTADELYRRLGKIHVGRPWSQQQAHAWWRSRLEELDWPSGGESSAAASAPASPAESSEADDEPDRARSPSVPMGAISGALLRARQRASEADRGAAGDI
jgi:serine/threonine-protein kinase